jgi:hypothetical protein
MKKSAKFFGKSLLALALGIIAVAGLAVAGLLSFYGKVVGTATVSQGVVLEIYDTSGTFLARATGDGSSIDLSADVVAGSTLKDFKYGDKEVGYLNISYLADGTVPAPLKIRVKLGDEFGGLFTEVVKFGVKALNPSNLQQEWYTVEIDATGVYLYSGNNLLASGTWDYNKVEIQYPSGNNPQFDFVVKRNDDSKELLIYGNTIVLPQLGGNEKSLIFQPFMVWNVATMPGNYRVSFSVEPA